MLKESEYRPFSINYAGSPIGYFEFLDFSNIRDVFSLFKRNFREPEKWCIFENMDQFLKIMLEQQVRFYELLKQNNLRNHDFFDHIPSSLTIVAFDNELASRIIGAVSAGRDFLSPYKWNIPIICVEGAGEPDYRRRGVGQALMFSMFEVIRCCGGTYVTADTNPQQLEGGSMTFLENCGFIKDGPPQKGYWNQSDTHVQKFYINLFPFEQN